MHTLSGDGAREHRRDNLGGLIKKIRGNSTGSESDTLESNGLVKKQTPISDRTDKPLSKILTGPGNPGYVGTGFSSVRVASERFDNTGSVTPHESAMGGFGFQNSIGSPENGSRVKNKWGNQSAIPARKASNSHVGNPISQESLASPHHASIVESTEPHWQQVETA